MADYQMARQSGVAHLEDRADLPKDYHDVTKELLARGGRVRCNHCRDYVRHFTAQCPFAEARLMRMRRERETGDVHTSTVDGARGFEEHRYA